MKLFLGLLLVAVAVPSAFSQLLFCHNCFGNSYCNDVNHTDFAANVGNNSCTVGGPNNTENSHHLLSQMGFALNQNFLKEFGHDQVAPLNFSIQGHCITATVFEPHDTHTLRTCVTRMVPTASSSNETLCQLLENTIAPMNRNNGTFSCRECNGTHYCNNHTLGLADGVAPPTQSGSSMIKTYVGVLMMTMFAFLLGLFSNI